MENSEYQELLNTLESVWIYAHLNGDKNLIDLIKERTTLFDDYNENIKKGNEEAIKEINGFEFQSLLKKLCPNCFE